MLRFELLGSAGVHHGLHDCFFFQHGPQFLWISWMVVLTTPAINNPTFGAEKFVKISKTFYKQLNFWCTRNILNM